MSRGSNAHEQCVTRVVYHLPQIPGNSGWDVNGKGFFGSSHWKIPGTNRNSEKVVPFSDSDVPNGNSFAIYKFLEFRTSFTDVVTRIQSSASRKPGNFRQMVNDAYRSYRPKIPNQNFLSVRTSDVSRRSSPLRDASRGGASATQRQQFHTDDAKSVRNPVRSANWSAE